MIPKVLHCCFGMARDFGGKPWGLSHYVCLRSAVERIAPAQTYLYYEYEPRGPWWKLAREIVTAVQIQAPREIFGNPLLHPAHRADIVRLEKLLQHGGIYLDTDVFVHRTFDCLLGHSVVLGREYGEEGEIGLCNAVILAEPNAPFLCRWYSAYKTFRSKGHDDFWNEHSVQLPSRLAKAFPDEVTILPNTAFFWPSWNNTGLEKLFVSNEPFPDGDRYANHLWENKAWEKYLEDLTPGRVRGVSSNFHSWARPMLSALPDNLGKPSVISLSTRSIKKCANQIAPKIKNRIRRMSRAAGEKISSIRPGQTPLNPP